MRADLDQTNIQVEEESERMEAVNINLKHQLADMTQQRDDMTTVCPFSNYHTTLFKVPCHLLQSTISPSSK